VATINQTNKLADKLARIVRSTQGLPRVSVGFLRDATYPDGTSVALVAAVNEFGAPSRGQPPRPFFRLMVANNSDTWPDAVAKNMLATDYDAHKTLDRVGQGIKGQLQQSIRDLTEPPLAPSTVQRKGFDKPLIDSGVMISAVDYRVEP
jgi:hypothetical protein